MEETTMNRWIRKEFNCSWIDIPHDFIYFAYPTEPDVMLRLICSDGLGGKLRGNVERANGSHHKGIGMTLTCPILVRGVSLSIIHIGGE